MFVWQILWQVYLAFWVPLSGCLCRHSSCPWTPWRLTSAPASWLPGLPRWWGWGEEGGRTVLSQVRDPPLPHVQGASDVVIQHPGPGLHFLDLLLHVLALLVSNISTITVMPIYLQNQLRSFRKLKQNQCLHNFLHIQWTFFVWP